MISVMIKNSEKEDLIVITCDGCEITDNCNKSKLELSGVKNQYIIPPDENPSLINPDSYFECIHCKTRFRISDGHKCPPPEEINLDDDGTTPTTRKKSFYDKNPDGGYVL